MEFFRYLDIHCYSCCSSSCCCLAHYGCSCSSSSCCCGSCGSSIAGALTISDINRKDPPIPSLFTVKLGYNDHSYNEFTAITNKYSFTFLVPNATFTT